MLGCDAFPEESQGIGPKEKGRVHIAQWPLHSLLLLSDVISQAKKKVLSSGVCTREQVEQTRAGMAAQVC